MRKKKQNGELSVQAIAATHVVLLGMDLPEPNAPGARRRDDGRSGHIVMVVPEADSNRARRKSDGEVIAPLQSQAGSEILVVQMLDFRHVQASHPLRGSYPMINQKISTVVVLTCLLHLPYVAFCKEKEDADKKEERVEIKCLVPEGNIETVAKRLNLDSDHPTETRVVCFYDTSSKTLFEHTPRVILRSRYTTDGSKTDTTIKIRGAKLKGEDVECESDQVIGKPPVESCSLTDKKQGVDEIKKANDGKNVKKIFNHDQEELLKKANIDVDWKSLVPFGPVEGVKVWKDVLVEGLEKVTVERWELPERDGKPRRVLFEVSSKAPLSQQSGATAALSKVLGVTDTEEQEQEQETKTKMVIDHFAGNHSAKP
jgi:hypothetical protein